MFQAQVPDQTLDAAVLLLDIDLQFEPGGESYGLLDAEVGEKDIILHDVRSIVGESVLVQRILVVQHQVSSQCHALFDSDPIRKQVQKGGFTGTRRAHYKGDLARQAEACHTFQDLQLPCRLGTRFYLLLRSLDGHCVPEIPETNLESLFT